METATVYITPRRKPRYVLQRAPLICFGLAVVAFLCLLCSPWGPFWSSREIGVTPTQANWWLWHYRVPDSATDVSYESGYLATNLECSLGEAAFLAWARDNEWSVIPIVEHVLVPTMQHEILEVEKGYTFSERTSATFTEVTYDTKSKTAYIRHFAT